MKLDNFKERRVLTFVAAFMAVLLALLILAGVVKALRSGVSAAPDFACGSSPSSTSSKTVAIDVAQGESGSSIAKDLFNSGVTKSSEAFFRLAVSDSRSSRIAPGVHQIEIGICAKDALDQLLDSKRIANLITVIEGAWNVEIKRSLVSLGYERAEVDRAFSMIRPPEGFSTLEGLLFPAQYSFDSSTALSEIVASMMKRGISELAQSGISQSGKVQGDKNFTAQELLIIASLVQAEGDEIDFAKISQVVRNRLKIGMPLQFDSTVHYIKGVRGSVFLSTKSTLISSPYNTYKRYGLPPGPINNPGRSAMYAASHPEFGDWLYFITVAPGDTRFTKSYQEFGEWKSLYKKNLRDGKFGGSN